MIPVSQSEWEIRLRKLHSLPGFAEMDTHVEPDKMKGFVRQWHQNKHAEPHPECVFCTANAEPVETIFTNKQTFALKVCFIRTKYRAGTLSQGWIDVLKTVAFNFNRGYSDHWMPFEQAREFVRALKLRGWKDWWAYCSSEKKPADIPANPAERYKTEWRGASDWFGTGRRDKRTKSDWRSFKKARVFTRRLGLKNQLEWAAYAKSKEKPEDIPATPSTVYEGKGWKSQGDWLGYTPMRRGNWRPFEEARAFIRSLGFQTGDEWRAYAKSDKLPDDIPNSPERRYAEYKDLGDWLGCKLRKRRRADESRMEKPTA